MVAEYRALRASVLRRWASDQQLVTSSIDDILRFNEAIDQAVAESLLSSLPRSNPGGRSSSRRSGMISEARWQRSSSRLTPCQWAAGTSLGQAGRADHQRQHAHEQAAGRPAGLQPQQAGRWDGHSSGGLRSCPIAWRGSRIASRCLPHVPITYEVEGDARGCFDASSLREAVHNLTTNAAKYGEHGTDVRISLEGLADQILITVSNTGAELSDEAFNSLFDPLRRGSLNASQGEHASLGLGLFLVREICHAHRGTVHGRWRDDAPHSSSRSRRMLIEATALATHYRNLCITKTSTNPRWPCRKASGSVPTTANPSFRYSATAGPLVLTT